MINLLTWLSKRRFPYEPLITIEISKSRLIHNLNEFRKLAPNGCIAPVLKSNAYGHGLIEVAEILETSNSKLQTPNSNIIPFFVVDSYFEAVALRAKYIHTPILIIGYTRPETIAIAKMKNISFTVTNMETLRALAKKAEIENTQGGMIGIQLPIVGARHPHVIHLKIDTGMRRQGIMPEEIGEAMDIIQRCESIILEGICSHLSDADNTDEAFTDGQIILWNKIVKQFKSKFPHLKYWHLSNTDGHRFKNEIEANVSRLGIGLYGLIDGKSFAPSLDLKPVLEMKTIISGIKKLKIGETVGYGNTFTALKDMTIATIPVGYCEGLDRRLSNSGTILVGPENIPCPIIGRVSMNITTIDVTNIKGLNVGAAVTVISHDSNQKNSIVEIAKKCGTISYEIAAKIPAQLKRVVVE
jgi:alanine racemase